MWGKDDEGEGGEGGGLTRCSSLEAPAVHIQCCREVWGKEDEGKGGGGEAHQVQPLGSTSHTHPVLQGGGAEVGVDDVAGVGSQLGHPGRELGRIRQGGGQEHHAGVLGQENDGLLPDHPPLAVLHVVDLIKDDPGHLPQDL